MKTPKDKNKTCLFLIGLFSMTQINVIGWIGISELVLFVLAPIFCVQDWHLLRKHGFSKIIWLAILMFIGGNLANFWNSILFNDAARGMASPYAIFAIIVCLHHFLWRNIDNMKWLLLGMACSSLVCTFVFQPGFDRVVGGQVLSGAEAVENRVGYSLFWFAQIGTWATLPIQTIYLATPSLYVYGVSGYLLSYALLSAGSRSGFGLLLASIVLLWLGGKNQKTMLKVRYNFVLLCLLGVLGVGIVGQVYKYAAVNGYMGDAQLHKYEEQSKRGTDMLSLLISGRTGFFAAFFAAIDKPIIGHGSWALDYKGYYRDFINKYGTAEEIDLYLNSARGRGENITWIPGHSQIMNGWTWYGIFGLIFWLYVLYLCLTTLKNYLWVIPQWYGYFCIALPSAIWAILFSPFGARIPTVLIFVACLFAIAIKEKSMPLPEAMRCKL